MTPEQLKIIALKCLLYLNEVTNKLLEGWEVIEFSMHPLKPFTTIFISGNCGDFIYTYSFIILGHVYTSEEELKVKGMKLEGMFKAHDKNILPRY